MLGQGKPSPAVFHVEGGERGGTKSPAPAREEEVI